MSPLCTICLLKLKLPFLLHNMPHTLGDAQRNAVAAAVVTAAAAAAAI